MSAQPAKFDGYVHSDIELIVYEQPAPQGSKRGFVVKGHVVMTEDSKKQPTWRQAVIASAVNHGGRIPGAVRVDIWFTVRKPKSAPKRKRTYPITSTDGDKLLRSTFDALVIAGTIDDDSRIVDWGGGKRYPGERSNALPRPGAIIRVSQVTD